MKLPVLEAPPLPDATPAGRGRGGPGGGAAGFAADPSKPGRFAVLMGRGNELRVSISEDYGATWSGLAVAGQTPNARGLSKSWMGYSRKGVLALIPSK